MSRAPLRSARLDVTIVHGGRPDELVRDVIEQAVHAALTAPGSDAVDRVPAWRRAARLEALGTQRIGSRIRLTGHARS